MWKTWQIKNHRASIRAGKSAEGGKVSLLSVAFHIDLGMAGTWASLWIATSNRFFHVFADDGKTISSEYD